MTHEHLTALSLTVPAETWREPLRQAAKDLTARDQMIAAMAPWLRFALCIKIEETCPIDLETGKPVFSWLDPDEVDGAKQLAHLIAAAEALSHHAARLRDWPAWLDTFIANPEAALETAS